MAELNPNLYQPEYLHLEYLFIIAKTYFILLILPLYCGQTCIFFSRLLNYSLGPLAQNKTYEFHNKLYFLAAMTKEVPSQKNITIISTVGVLVSLLILIIALLIVYIMKLRARLDTTRQRLYPKVHICSG